MNNKILVPTSTKRRTYHTESCLATADPLYYAVASVVSTSAISPKSHPKRPIAAARCPHAAGAAKRHAPRGARGVGGGGPEQLVALVQRRRGFGEPRVREHLRGGGALARVEVEHR